MNLNSMLYEKEGNVAIMSFNRPKVMNAIDKGVLEDIIAITEEIARDEEVKAVILTGGAKVFAAGGDIDAMLTVTPVQCESFIEECHKAFNGLTALDKPVIAAIAGLAFGGGLEVSLACDIRIAAEGTMFGAPETNLGLFPAGGGTQRITKMAGVSWAKHMVLTGDPIDAETAFRIGIITKIVPAEALMDEAKKMAKKLAAKAPITTKIVKQCLNNSIYADLNSSLLFEQKCFAHIFATEDHLEGMRAFMEKRKPEFKGR